jgi:Rhodopirellula transposase DDE domain
MDTDRAISIVRQKYQDLVLIMDEKLRRRWAASEAVALGWGGITAVSEATGLSHTTIRLGIAESRALEADPNLPPQNPHVRRPGGGRKRLAEEDQTLLMDLETLVNPSTRGDPQSPLRWTCKSTRNLAGALVDQGHRVSHQTVARWLQATGDNLPVNRKNRESGSHPDRDAQFESIAEQVRSFQRRGQPVVSVDTKKEELVGDFKNAGREWQPEGSPEEVRGKDFKDKGPGKVAPDGVSDQTTDKGWVRVGIDPDTAQFATEARRRWWSNMGIGVYPRATDLLVTADGGGSNGSRSR